MKKRTTGELDPNQYPIAKLIAPFRDAMLALGRSANGLRTVVCDVNKLARFAGRTELSAVTPNRLEEFMSWLKSTPMQDTWGNPVLLSVAGRARTIADVRGFLRWAYRAGHTPTDLARHLLIPRLPRPLPRDIPSLGEITELIRRQKQRGDTIGLRNAAVIAMLFATGLRRDELARLTLKDVDLKEREVRVNCGKGGRGRLALFSVWARDVLVRYLKESRPKLSKTGTDRLFLNYTGEPSAGQDLTAALKLACTEANLKKFTPHSLRHAFCLQLLKGGASIRVVNELAGHKMLKFTARYTRLSVSDLQQVVGKSHPLGR
jgi:site-specific recombinase XerD